MKLVGDFIKNKRKSLKLSQKKLADLFDPPVTVQFISGIERGRTPFPPHHISFLARVFSISESTILELLEKEYAKRIRQEIFGEKK